MILDARGISIELEIHEYEPSSKTKELDNWCKCDFAFRSGEWLNYHKENDEVFLPFEVEKLEHTLTRLLDDELKEVEKILCMEPDFDFSFHPKQDLSKNPNYSHLPPEHQIKDIFVEWIVHFWHEGLTNHSLTVTLDRETIIAFRNYLSYVIQTDNFTKLYAYAEEKISSGHLQKGGLVIAAVSSGGSIYHKIVKNPCDEELQRLDAESFIKELTKNRDTQLNKIVCLWADKYQSLDVLPQHFRKLIYAANHANRKTKILLSDSSGYLVKELCQTFPPFAE